MKKIILIFGFIILSNLTAIACDQVFDGGMLRYNYSYTFYDTWHNNANRNVYLNDYNVSFVNPSFLDKGGNFAWTQQLRSSDFTVSPKTSMRVLETGAPKRKIANKPNVRTNGTRNSYDFGIEYTIKYDFSNNYPNATDDESHKECVYYSVSWCGDGVRDTAYETCDPNDPTRLGWGTGGCSATCEPVVAPITPKCSNLTYFRDNNNYTFTCTADKSGATKYELVVNGAVRMTQNNGNFTPITLAATDTVECRVDNEVANLVSNNCKYSNIGTELSCTSLTANPIAGIGNKTFTSVGVGVGSGGKHDLFKNNMIIASENASNRATFSNVMTANNDIFQSFVQNARGNRATSDTCRFTATEGIPCVRGNIILPLTARITSSTPGLCLAGQAVTDFTETQVGTNFNYTWGCNNSAVGGSCSAIFNPNSLSACTSLRYERNENNFTFRCNASGSPSGYTLFDGAGNTLATNTTGVFNLPLSDNLDVYCRVTGETATIPECRVNDVLTRMACNTLGVDVPNGAGTKVFTSTSTSLPGVVINRHTLSQAATQVGDSTIQAVHTPTWVFNNISAQVNNQFRSRVFDSLGNSATGNSCLRTIGPDNNGSTQCLSLTASPNSGTAPTTSTFTCDYVNGATNVIEIYNGTTLLQSFSSLTGSYTFSSPGTYSARCFVNDSRITSDACATNITITSGPGGGGGCMHGGIFGAQSNPILVTTSGLCEPGRTPLDFQVTPSGSTTNYSWQCSGYSGTRCTASYSPGGGSSSGGNSSGGSPSTFCGDGNLDRPNTDGMMEQCDFGGSAPWSNWPNWCGKPDEPNACQIIENTTPGGGIDGNTTIPGGGSLTIEPQGNILIGHGMSILGNLPVSNRNTIKITNSSTSDVYIDKPLCVRPYHNSIEVISGGPFCSSQDIGLLGRLGGNQSFPIPNNRFVGNTSQLGGLFGDAQLITGVDGVPVTSFLNAFLNVRVAKPSIQTGGGGAGLVEDTDGISDVNTLSKKSLGNFGDLRPDFNNNLILSSLGLTPLSSNVGVKISDTIKVEQAKNREQDNINGLSNIDIGGSSSNLTAWPTTKFNGLENVFIHKGDASLQGTVAGKRTYIFEGNLNIIGNITSPHNVLLVVKGGDVKISSNVSKIDAIILVLGDGKIKGEQTNTQLTVNGALYGDVSDLVKNRTFIKGREDGLIDVGTNVNFTSKIFTNPPPLLSRFLNEFVEGNKLAK